MSKKVPVEYNGLKKIISSYIEKYPNLGRKANIENLKNLKKMDPNSKEYIELRHHIALSNGGFGMKYAMKYYSVLNDEVSISELFQESMIGILESIDDFDISRKTSFTTYAYFHVIKRLIDYIKNYKLVRAPRDIARNMKHVNEIQNTLLCQLGRDPTISEIVEAMDNIKNIEIKDNTVDNILILLDLNSSNNDDSFISEYRDQLYYEDDNNLFKNMELNLKKELSSLLDRNKEAAILRFGIGMEYTHTPEEVRLLLESTPNEFKSLT